MAKTKFRFSIFGLFHRQYRGSEVTMGSEDTLKIFWKDMFVQKGQVEHVLTMANLKLKPSLFTPRPNVQNCYLLIKSQLYYYLVLLLGMIMIVAYAGGSSLFCVSQRGVITFLVLTKGGSHVFVRCFAGSYRPPGRNNERSLISLIN